jgi:hypothetical protein
MPSIHNNNQRLVQATLFLVQLPPVTADWLCKYLQVSRKTVVTEKLTTWLK